MKFQKILKIEFEKCVTNLFNIQNQIDHNNKIMNMKEYKRYSAKELKEEHKNYDRNHPCMIIETDIYNKKFQKKYSIVSFDYDEKNQTLFFLSKPYYPKENQNSKKKVEICVNKNEKKFEEKEVELFFSMEFIYLKKITDERTEYCEIDLFPLTSSSTFQKKKKIINRTVSKKKFLFSCLNDDDIYSDFGYYKYSNHDLFSNLLNEFEWVVKSNSYVNAVEGDYKINEDESKKSKKNNLLHNFAKFLKKEVTKNN